MNSFKPIFSVFFMILILCGCEKYPPPAYPDIEMISIEGGTFEMGCDTGEYMEKPVHTVTVNSFQLSKYEITNKQYCAFLNNMEITDMGYHGDALYIKLKDSLCQITYNNGKCKPVTGKENYPVIFVTLHGAKAFCEWMDGRLPSEAEWEYAAKGGNLSKGYIYSGSNEPDEVAWYQKNSDNPDNAMFEGQGTHEVGLKKPNELGLYDMSGNVHEWCCNKYYSYSNPPEDESTNCSDKSLRPVRGGCWYNWAFDARCTHREWWFVDFASYKIGFRLYKQIKN